MFCGFVCWYCVWLGCGVVACWLAVAIVWLDLFILLFCGGCLSCCLMGWRLLCLFGLLILVVLAMCYCLILYINTDWFLFMVFVLVFDIVLMWIMFACGIGVCDMVCVLVGSCSGYFFV